MSEATSLSPSRLSTYAACPRRFDYEHVQSVATPDETRLYLTQGRAYHEAIEAVCSRTGPDDDPEEIRDRARSAFERAWDAHVEPDEYASHAHEEYQYAQNRAAIESFFDPDGGDGIDHARRSVATELSVSFVRDGRGFHGRVDNVLRTDGGLHVVDYKRTCRGVVSPWSADALRDHLDGTGYDPKRVRNAFQMATYVEGVRASDLYEEGTDVRFSFYGLLHDTTVEATPTGYEVSVRAGEREATGVYAEYEETIWRLAERAHDGITSESYDPEPFDLLAEEACPDCAYAPTCADRLSTEVRR